jgi:hypothetical protein
MNLTADHWITGSLDHSNALPTHSWYLASLACPCHLLPASFTCLNVSQQRGFGSGAISSPYRAPAAAHAAVPEVVEAWSK